MESSENSGVNDARNRIVALLKHQSPLTPVELANFLGQTSSSIRQHLDGLFEAGLIETASGPIAAGRGRPATYWQLSHHGNRLFPDHHDQVAVELINTIRHVLGEGALDKVIDERTQRQANEYTVSLSRERSLESKVNRLADLRSAEGYMAQTRRVGPNEWELVEHHCPICDAAQVCQGFCRGELDAFQASLGDVATVERTQHLLSGDQRCVYTIRRARGGRLVVI